LSVGGSVVAVGAEESNVSPAETMAPSDTGAGEGTAPCSGDTDAAAVDADGTVGLSQDVSCVT